MAQSPGSIREFRDVDSDIFQNDIVPLNQPAILRSLVENWPAVAQSRQSAGDLCTYLKQFDTGQAVSATVGAPAIKGRFFYRDDVDGFNFERKRVAVSTALDNLLKLLEQPEPPSIAMQAIPINEVLPGFGQDNTLSLVDSAVAPRLWLGNRAMVAAHYDLYYNIACVVAGRRRFTLFPPDQVSNLYVGPLLATPGGSPISMVDVRNPDLARYPRYAQAQAVCQEAVLEPGDAIYIPILWWHAVESLDSLNVLVNYWWSASSTNADGPFHSMLHSMLAISELPADQREVWRAFFDHFVFRVHGDPAGHLPEGVQDILGSLPPDKRQQLEQWLAQQLSS